MLYTDSRARGPIRRTVPKLLQLGLWITVLAIAFFMQVVPFLLVLTMFNLAIGVTSGVALVLIPVVAFGMLSFACWIATRQTKALTGEAQVREHAKRQIYIAPYAKRGGAMDARNAQAALALRLQRWRSRLY